MKRIRIALAFGLITAVLLSVARFDALCDEMRQGVFRLHIVANSDAPEDQALKLRVRDAVLTRCTPWLTECADCEETQQTLQAHMEEIVETARCALRDGGCEQNVQARVETCYFNTRVYEDFTLPAGEYQALNLVIGEGRGQNWWCVLFPAVCLSPDVKLEDAIDEESAYAAEHPQQYRMRFKTVEVYRRIREKIAKKEK